MRELFKKPEPGLQLTARYVNRLTRVLRRGSSSGSGGRINSSHSSQGRTFAQQSPFTQENLTVVTANNTSKIHTVRIRYYHSGLQSWATDTSVDYEMDSTDDGREYSDDDKLIGYWDVSRKMFIPLF